MICDSEHSVAYELQNGSATIAADHVRKPEHCTLSVPLANLQIVLQIHVISVFVSCSRVG